MRSEFRRGMSYAQCVCVHVCPEATSYKVNNE